MTGLTEAWATRCARIALGHVARPYPNNPGHVLRDGADHRSPRALHPVFFGSFDWHSCVHGYWLLARVLRRFPAGPEAGRIRTAFDTAFTTAAVAGECAYFAEPGTGGFERPYGWAWLLKLADELEAGGFAWAKAIDPLAALIADRFRAHLPRATYPTRAGTHGNTAFALRLAFDYAERRDPMLGSLIVAAATRWYAGDAACQAWEPDGEDFLSPALVEAECLRRLLPSDTFAPWFTRFLPGLAAGEPATLFRPAMAVDRSDGRMAHLDGLNLSRAWCWRALLATLPDGHPARDGIETAIAAHLAASLPNLSVHYMGEHWLATYALLALDGA